ncbi:diversity-generating retroelement protein Avd [candidate division KSB1 bacterium]|nr:diversity-generating retroelement protein Avd [bacterium]NUM68940.1 diversity-generating retroelement protein Avd [candidate division KSB1 bacterium]
MAQKENLLTRLEDFIVWYLPHLESFPRNYKFLLGDRSVKILLDILEEVADAYYSKDKLEKLQRANIQLEKLRRLLAICTRMKFLSTKQLAFASNRLYEIGTDLGGWIKQVARGKGPETRQSPA